MAPLTNCIACPTVRIEQNKCISVKETSARRFRIRKTIEKCIYRLISLET